MISKFLTVLLFTVFACLLPLSVLASTVDNRFNEANAAYSRSDYSAAIAIYNQIIEERGFSAGVLYNLANSYAMNGKAGLAILNYERALVLAPGDSDIAGNLQLVRTASGLFEEELTFSERILHTLSMDQWTMVGGLALLLLTATLLTATLRPKMKRRIVVLISCCCLLGTVVAIISVLQLQRRWDSSVVVVASRLQVSPFEGAATAGEIREGSRVYTSKHHGDYLYVVDDTKRKGWIEGSAIEPVIPDKLN